MLRLSKRQANHRQGTVPALPRCGCATLARLGALGRKSCAGQHEGFTPDRSASIGFKAGVFLSARKSQAFGIAPFRLESC